MKFKGENNMSIVEKKVWDNIFDPNNSKFENDFNDVLKFYLKHAEEHLDEYDEETQEKRKKEIEAFKTRTSDSNWVAKLKVSKIVEIPEAARDKMGQILENITMCWNCR